MPRLVGNYPKQNELRILVSLILENYFHSLFFGFFYLFVWFLSTCYPPFYLLLILIMLWVKLCDYNTSCCLRPQREIRIVIVDFQLLAQKHYPGVTFLFLLALFLFRLVLCTRCSYHQDTTTKATGRRKTHNEDYPRVHWLNLPCPSVLWLRILRIGVTRVAHSFIANT